MDNLKSKLVFLKEFVREFEAVGAFCPTSAFAARAMTEELVGPRAPMRILEAGPGTGSVTDQILKRMIPGDELVLCEINPRLMKVLKDNLEKSPLYPRLKDQISFVTGAVQELPRAKPFDMIVCAIPFLNLEAPIIIDIFASFQEMSHSQTVMTYYEYIALKRLGKAVSRSRRERVRTIEPLMKGIREDADSAKKNVWLNMPPIHVYRLKNLQAINLEAAEQLELADRASSTQSSDPLLAA